MRGLSQLSRPGRQAVTSLPPTKMNEPGKMGSGWQGTKLGKATWEMAQRTDGPVDKLGYKSEDGAE